MWTSGFCAQGFGAPKIAETGGDAEPYGDGVGDAFRRWMAIQRASGRGFGRRAETAEHVNNSGACDSGRVVVVSMELGAVSASGLIHRTVTSSKMYAVAHPDVTYALSCKSHRC